MLQNDWLVASINNPGFTTQDYYTYTDMNTNNTQFLTKDEYLKYDYIKENDAFKNDDGEFDANIFDAFYTTIAREWKDFQKGESVVDRVYDVFDTLRPDNALTNNTSFSIERFINPDQQKIGYEGINVTSAPEFSARELAEQNKVYNYANQVFENYTPNDLTLVKDAESWFNSFTNPLVMATWESDGVHTDMLGQTVEHKAGEYKLDENGHYYAETLSGRNPTGLTVLSAFDRLTVDGEGLNKYDFFDSDDLEKSIPGSIAKTAAAMLPLLHPATATVYGATLISRDLAKTLPMLYGMVTALNDSSTPEWVNTIAGMASTATTTQSDYATNHTVTMESVFNMAADVATQWGTQNLIAKAFTKMGTGKDILKKANEKAAQLYAQKRLTVRGIDDDILKQACIDKFLPEATRRAEKAAVWGQNASLAYMAMVSNADLYDNMIQQGATKAEAALVALGGICGMYAFDKYTGLGELFYDESGPKLTDQVRKAVLHEFEDASTIFANKGVKEITEKKAINILHRAAEKGKNAITNFYKEIKENTAGLVGKSIGEGLEEVGENVVQSLVKEIYGLAGTFGVDTSVKRKDLDIWDSPEEYLVTFLGGAVGGGMFYGKQWLLGQLPTKQVDQDLATLIRNGYADDVRKEWSAVERQHKFGSSTLSASTYDIDSEGEVIWKTAQGDEKTQAAFIADLVHDKIDSLEEILVSNQVGLSDDELFDNMIMKEQRFKQYKEVAPLTNYYQDFTNNLNSLIEAENKYRAANDTIDGTLKGKVVKKDSDLTSLSDEKKEKRKANLKIFEDKVNEAKQKIQDFLSGDSSLEYVRKLHFAMDPNLHSAFLDLDKRAYFQKTMGKAVEQATDEDVVKFERKWDEYIKAELKTRLSEGYEKFRNFEEVIKPHLGSLATNAEPYKEWVKKLDNFLPPDFAQWYDALQAAIVEKSNAPSIALSKKSLDLIKALKGNEDADDPDVVTQEDIDNYIGILTGEEFTPKVIEEDGKPVIVEDEYETQEETESRIEEDKKAVLEAALNKNKEIEQFVVDEKNALVNSVLEQLKAVDYKVDAYTLRKLEDAFHGNLNPKVIINSLLERSAFTQKEKETLGLLKNDLSNQQEIRNLFLVEKVKDIQYKINAGLQGFVSNSLVQRIKINGNRAFSDARLPLHTLTLYDIIQIYNNSEENIPQEYTTENGAKYTFDFASLLEPTRAEQERAAHDGKEPISGVELLSEFKSFVNRLQEDVPEYFLKAHYLNFEQQGIFLQKVKADAAAEKQFIEKLALEEDKDGSLKKLETFFKNIQEDPFYKLRQTLKTEVVNPIAALVNDIVTANNDSIPNLETFLQNIQNQANGYVNLEDLQLDDSQIRDLEKLKAYLNLLNRYVYAASVTADTDIPIGHNASINAFVEKNSSKLRKVWDKLPEMSSDYAVLHGSTITKYISEIDRWIELSMANSMNKIRAFQRIDQAFNQAIFGILNNIPTTIEVDGEKEELHLNEEEVDTSLLKEKAQIPVYKKERALFKAINEMAKKRGSSLEDFVINNGILQQLLGKDFKLTDLHPTALNPQVDKTGLTTYDQMIYLITVLSEDPAKFYSSLKVNIETNKANNVEKAPIVTQEYAARIALVSLNPTFKALLKNSFKNANQNDYTLLENTVTIFGAAGSGKTDVVLQSINERLKNEKIAILGPCEQVASKLKDTLKRDSYSVSDSFFESILGKEQWDKIKESLETKRTANTAETDFFKMSVTSTGGIKIELKENNIKFTEKAQKAAYKAIIFDEATRLSTVEAAILNLYAGKIGAQIFFAGDSLQLGHANNKNGIRNIGRGDVFNACPPELSISLRDNNIQKFQNQDKLRTVLKRVNDLYDYASTEEYQNYAQELQTAISDIQFRAYANDDIKGEYITEEIDDVLANTLKTKKAEGKSVAFIGSKDSNTLTSLRNKGVNIEDSLVFSLAEMQGQEFDYVVINHDFLANLNLENASTEQLRILLTSLYTALTRAREGSIIIDNNLSTIIKPNQIDQKTALAPSVKKAASEMQGVKLDILKELDFSSIEENAKSTTTVEPTEKPIEETPENLPITETNLEDTNLEETDNKVVEEGEEEKEESTSEDEEPVDENTDDNTDEVNNDTNDDAPNDSNTEDESLEEESDNAEPVTETIENFQRTDEIIDESIFTGDLTNNNLIDSANLGEDNPSTEGSTGSVQIFDPGILRVHSDSQNSDQKADLPIESYGDVTYVGYEGADNRTGKWNIRIPESGVLRNAQALISEDVELSSYSDKLDIEKRLFDLKSYVLFPSNTSKELPESLGRLFTKNELDEGTFEIEFRKVSSTDTLPLTRGMMRDIGESHDDELPGERVIATIVFKVNREVNGEIRECRFDIAGLNNPDKMLDGKVKEAIKKKVQLLASKNPNSESLNTAKSLVEDENALSAKIIEYSKWYYEQIDKLKSQDSVSYEIKKDALSFNRTTWFVRSEGPYRVGGNYDPGKVLTDKNPKRDELSFRGENRDKVIAGPFIIGKGEDNKLLIPQGSDKKSLSGRAFMLVSDDKSLNPDDLLSAYLNQKYNQREAQNGNYNGSTPVVRMVMLESYGASFSLLRKIEHEEDLFRSPIGGVPRRPVSQNYTGVRMFTSMWNARASLIHFIEKVEEFAEAQGQDAAKIDNWVKANIENANNGRGNEILEAFNTDTCKDIPMFRLGTTSTGHTVHVNAFPKNGNQNGDDSYNKCVISYNEAQKWLKILDVYFSGLVKDVTSNANVEDYSYTSSLGLRFGYKDNNGNQHLLQRGDYINLNKNGHKMALSNLFNFSGHNLIITNPDKNNDRGDLYAEGDHWSLLLKYVTDTTRTILGFCKNEQNGDSYYNEGQGTDDHSLHTNTLYILEDHSTGKRTNLNVQVNLQELLRDGRDGRTPGVLYTPNGSDEEAGKSLLEMFDMIFHGTLQDFHTKKVQRVGEAYFKHGFLMDTMATYEVVHSDDNNNYKIYRCATPEELLTVNVKMRKSGVQVSLNALLDLGKNPVTLSDEDSDPENDVLPVDDNNDVKSDTISVDVIDTILGNYDINDSPDETSDEDLYNKLYDLSSAKKRLSNDFPVRIVRNEDDDVESAVTIENLIRKLFKNEKVELNDFTIEKESSKNILTIKTGNKDYLVEFNLNEDGSSQNEDPITLNFLNQNPASTDGTNNLDNVQNSINFGKEYSDDNMDYESSLSDFVSHECYEQFMQYVKEERSFENLEDLIEKFQEDCRNKNISNYDVEAACDAITVLLNGNNC